MGKNRKKQRNQLKKEKQFKTDALDLQYKMKKNMKPDEFERLVFPTFNSVEKYPETIRRRLMRLGVMDANIPPPDPKHVMDILSLRTTL